MKWSCEQQRLLRRLGCEHIWTPLRAKQTQYYYGFSLCSCLLMVSTGRWCSEWLLLQLVQSPLFCLLNCYMMQIFLEKSGFSFIFFSLPVHTLNLPRYFWSHAFMWSIYQDTIAGAGFLVWFFFTSLHAKNSVQTCLFQ